MSGKLILVATPIGTITDLSARAVENLSAADFIAAEDTRVTLRLLNYYGIKKPLISYFEHNKRMKGDYIVSRILAGETCVLVSDAGMPGISDPGEELVGQCVAAGIDVTVIPGPCALINAVVLSGLPTGRFSFEGFLSTNKKSRLEHLEQIKNSPGTLIFYEAPHKLTATLEDLYRTLGDRRISLCRELTKLHETIVRTTLSRAAELYREEPPRGEFVLVVEGAAPEAPAQPNLDTGLARMEELIAGGMTAADAARAAAKETGLKKNELYAAYHGKNREE